MGVSTIAEKIAALGDMVTAATGSLDVAEVVLITADFAPSQDLVLADLTLASFAGYAPSTVTWGAPYQDSADNQAKVSGGDHQFTPTDALLPETVYGWGLTDAAGTSLLYVEHLDTPIPLPGPPYSALVHVLFTYGE